MTILASRRLLPILHVTVCYHLTMHQLLTVTVRITILHEAHNINYNYVADIDVYNGNETTLFGLASIIITYSAIRLLFELYQLVSSASQACSPLKIKNRGDTNLCLNAFTAFKRINYIWSLNNWIEVPLFMLSLIFAAVVIHSRYGMSFCLITWQWQIGVIVIWLSWIEFIFLSTQFRLIGVHALMFIRVLKTILKFIPLALLLILAFGLTFHFLLYQPELKVYCTQ